MPAGEPTGRDLGLMHQAARLYYLDEVNQAGVAERLKVSRPTVSRLLSEARRIGLVQITVHDPATIADDKDLNRLAGALGIERVWLAPLRGENTIEALREPVHQALHLLGLVPGDVLLVSSGRTVYELSRTGLPAMPGVDIGPTVGGVAEPEPWHQTNEITRAVAERMRARPHFLFAQAMPSAAMRATLAEDPDFQRVTGMWSVAKAALVGVGAPPVSRDSISAFIPLDDHSLRTAVGDVCLNFYGPDGAEIDFPGSERMVRISPDQLRAIPRVIAVASGEDKIQSVIAGARAGLFTQLATDIPTAEHLLAALDQRA
ncbi:sugar-binding transcriptional regulator [Pseudonocardia spinosispora]|uniref:sugar-binding transcriptional regulator n=1 Tax=Pseudonocardia spinosispora TaxID=103441 RepID=UPI0003FE2497|nr:sugar-binding domain-containing protein [Pseudonocardia spinosispora]